LAAGFTEKQLPYWLGLKAEAIENNPMNTKELKDTKQIKQTKQTKHTLIQMKPAGTKPSRGNGSS
jgi:hypothetical protein